MMRVPRTVQKVSGPLVVVDRGDGNLFKVRDTRAFLSRNPHGHVVGSASRQGAAEPAAGSLVARLDELSIRELRELASEQQIKVSGKKADIVRGLVRGGVQLPEPEEETEAEDDEEDESED